MVRTSRRGCDNPGSTPGVDTFPIRLVATLFILRSSPAAAAAFVAERLQDSLPEWSKGVDSSSTSASCVGSNPTGVILPLPSIAADSLAILARLAAAKQEATWPNG